MNALTKQLVEEVARRHKKIAANDPQTFAFLMDQHYWDHITGTYGEPLKSRAERLFVSLRPDLADPDDPTRLDDAYYMTCIDERLSQIVIGLLERMIARDTEMQLTAWGDYPAEVLRPKVTDLPLFKELAR